MVLSNESKFIYFFYFYLILCLYFSARIQHPHNFIGK